MFDLETHLASSHASLFSELADNGLAKWAEQLRASTRQLLRCSNSGHLPKWIQAIASLPEIEVTNAHLARPVVTFAGTATLPQRATIAEVFRVFHPWRKGPFELFGVHLNAEWRSDLKWQRVAPHIDLQQKVVLDVGCGNGYYGWRMLGAGARRIVGLEPYLLYNLQHATFQRYVPTLLNHVIPAPDRILDLDLQFFDVTFSMGVLYHCKNPIEHLEFLRRSLKSGGNVVLETLVIEGDVQTSLIPSNRYAKMRNVWLIPSTLMLIRLMQRVGFSEVEVVDVTKTTTFEQRRTKWMTFESLGDFLDPQNSDKTIEGCPAPRRATIIAKKAT